MSDSNAYTQSNWPRQRHRLYRVTVESEGTAGMQYVLVLAEGGPADAAWLALQRVQDRWPTRARVRHCWSFPPGELTLLGVDQVELLGTPIDVIDTGWAPVPGDRDVRRDLSVERGYAPADRPPHDGGRHDG